MKATFLERQMMKCPECRGPLAVEIDQFGIALISTNPGLPVAVKVCCGDCSKGFWFNRVDLFVVEEDDEF